MNFFSGTRTMGKAVAAGAILAALACVAPLKAADDLPIVGDIRMPEVNVDVRIGDDEFAAPPPRPFPRPAMVYPRGPYAPIPPARLQAELIDLPSVSPHQVAAMLRSTGYSLLGGINRRGWVYTVAVIDPRGDDGRAIIDARTGAIIRFIPAYAVDARLDDRLGVIYGPPGPPPAMRDVGRASRSPQSVPLAQRNPGAKRAVAPTDAKSSKDKAADARAEMKPASTPQPTTPKLWPTQAMPDVQLLD